MSMLSRAVRALLVMAAFGAAVACADGDSDVDASTSPPAIFSAESPTSRLAGALVDLTPALGRQHEATAAFDPSVERTTERLFESLMEPTVPAQNWAVELDGLGRDADERATLDDLVAKMRALVVHRDEVLLAERCLSDGEFRVTECRADIDDATAQLEGIVAMLEETRTAAESLD